MIEHIFDTECVGCNECVSACPTHVFDISPTGGAPVIARPEQCQTCFLCELYCDADAIYVGPDQHGVSNTDPEMIKASGILGQMRRDHLWNGAGSDPDALAAYWQLGPLLNEGVRIATDRYQARRR